MPLWSLGWTCGGAMSHSCGRRRRRVVIRSARSAPQLGQGRNDSIARFIAECFRFFTLIQCGDRLVRWGKNHQSIG